MRNFIKNNIGKLLFAIIFAIIGGIIASNSFKEKTYFESVKTLRSLEFDGNNAYLKFYDDETTYIAYENNGVDFALLGELDSGDLVNIKLKETSGESTYTIIYTLKQGDKVIFDVMEYYRKNDLVVSTILITIPFSISVLLLMFSITSFKKDTNNPNEFVMRFPNWVKHFFVVTFSVAFIAFIELLAFCLSGLVPSHNYAFLSLPGFFLILGLVGVIIYFRASFSLKNGIYKSVELFAVKQAKASEIAVAYVSNNLLKKIYFVNENDEIICKFYKESIAYNEDLFVESLNIHNIKIENTILSRSIDENKHIKALRLFDKKEFKEAYPLFVELYNVKNDEYYKYYLMICSIYFGDINNGIKYYNEIMNNLHLVKKGLIITYNFTYNPKIIEYNFALALITNKFVEEAKVHLNLLMKLATNGDFSNDKDVTRIMMVELIDKIILDEEERMTFYKKI